MKPIHQYLRIFIQTDAITIQIPSAQITRLDFNNQHHNRETTANQIKPSETKEI